MTSYRFRGNYTTENLWIKFKMTITDSITRYIPAKKPCQKGFYPSITAKIWKPLKKG